MFIKKNSEIFLIRLNTTGYNNAINDHIELINKHGYVWLQKRGRKARIERLTDVLVQGGYIIIKEPKHNGDRYFIGQFVEVADQLPNEENTYPDYYNKYKNYENRSQWFKITSLTQLNNDDIEELYFASSKEKVTNIINSTSTAFMFVFCKRDIIK